MEIVKALRLATKELHTQLDTNLPLAQTSPTLADYGQHLMVFHLWLEEIGRLVEHDSESQFSEFSHHYSHALNLLRKDIAALSHEEQLEHERYNLESPVMSTLSLPWLQGIEYVVKGSALGNTFLYPKLLQQFPDASFCYMQDSALHGKTRWQDFLARLDQLAWTPETQRIATDGAIWAFRQFIEISQRYRETA